MRFAERASWSIKFATFWAADYIISLFLDLEGYLRTLALLGLPLGMLPQ
jgi:hypothetical protein